MIFSSISFLFYFLPLFLIAYFLLPFKNMVLLVFSLIFYAWGEIGYTLLLLFSICLNYFTGLLINHQLSNKKLAKSYLAVGITLNLLLLGYYKYFNFITENLSILTTDSKVHLPLGISFFTFQAISYLFDIYRKEAKVEKNILNLALYISMFPQLIAGPIVRFKTVAHQIGNRVSELNNISNGIRIFIIGLAQKANIANTLAIPADNVFSLNESVLTTSVAWFGAICYSFQIYFDFAGYSNMAIGIGLIIGFTFPKNFNYPYISQSITEFWKRWHMSLSSWFKDYLYIPLGGNRGKPIKTYINLMVVFVLCGLWHGAAWTFIIWGIYHGAFLIIERSQLGNMISKLWKPIQHIYTLLVLIIGWVIFRVDNMEHFQFYFKNLFGLGNGTTQVETLDSMLSNSTMTVLVFAVIFSAPLFLLVKQKINAIHINTNYIKKQMITLSFDIVLFSVLLMSMIKIANGSYNPFIYFRF